MTLQSEIQLDAIANVPEQHRYLMIDSTGSLVKNNQAYESPLQQSKYLNYSIK